MEIELTPEDRDNLRWALADRITVLRSRAAEVRPKDPEWAEEIETRADAISGLGTRLGVW